MAVTTLLAAMPYDQKHAYHMGLDRRYQDLRNNGRRGSVAARRHVAEVQGRFDLYLLPFNE